METNSNAPQQQLDAIQQARAGAADRLVSQPWYHRSLGAVAGAFVAVWGLAPDDERTTLGVLAVLVLAVMETGYQRRTGLRTRALRHPRVLLWSLGIGAALVVATTAVLVATTVGLSRPVEVVSVLAIAVVLAVGSAYASRRAEAATTADLSRDLTRDL